MGSPQGGPQRVARNPEQRERQMEQAAGDGPGDNRRVSAIRIMGPYEGIEAIAEEQRPIEVRVPYRPRGEEIERILAMDLLYNPGARSWQMVEMRFEQVLEEAGG